MALAAPADVLLAATADVLLAATPDVLLAATADVLLVAAADVLLLPLLAEFRAIAGSAAAIDAATTSTEGAKCTKALYRNTP